MSRGHAHSARDRRCPRASEATAPNRRRPLAPPLHRPFDSGKLTAVLLFLPPALLLFTLFVVMPVVEAAWYCGFNWNGFGSPKNWVGFDNYRFVFDNRAFGLAFRNNILIIAGLAADPVAAGAVAGR